MLTGLVVVGLGVAAAIVLTRAGSGPSSPGRPFVGGDLHSLVMAPATSSRLYVGGHEGVAVSTDGGRTWRQVDSLAGADAMGWAFTDEVALVGGHPGLYVSDDDGRTFRRDNEGLPATDIHALGSGAGVIYAASPQLGVFASTDGGASWEVRTDQVGQAFMGTILVDPRDPDRIVAPDMQAGAVQSSDGGRSWSVLGGVPGAMWVSRDPANTDRIVASGMGQAALTRDGGRTWAQLEVPDGASVVEIDPTDSDTLYAGVLQRTEAVVWVSRDGGSTWTMP
ncbi:MAG: WD40/YVTN/BNR-like repeat-containing protein [Actinomycetota bacterium]